MDRSPRANIFEITRLLEHFNDRNANLFKKCLFKQLHCTKESQWLCKAIIHSAPSLFNNKSLTTLRDKAISIAELQAHSKSIKKHKHKQKRKEKEKETEKGKHYSLYKWLQEKYGDCFCQLPSDIIDHLGTFLNKNESIQFGWLNKQLYIETQKQSYLTKRMNDNALKLSSKMVDRFSWKQTNPFSYCLPRQLIVKNWVASNQIDESSSLNPWNFLFESQWFETMFTQLNKFECNVFKCLQYIPIKLLFNVKQNQNHKFNINNNNSNGNMIDCLQFDLLNRCTFDCIQPFCARLMEYHKNMITSNGNDSGVRNIKELHIIGYVPNSWAFDANTENEETWSQQHKMAMERLLLAMASLSRTIKLNNARFTIGKDSLQSIFHSKLEELIFVDDFNGKLSCAVGDCNNNNNNETDTIATTATTAGNEAVDDVSGDDINVKAPNLRCITRDIAIGKSEDNVFLKFLQDLDYFGLGKQIECYKLCNTSHRGWGFFDSRDEEAWNSDSIALRGTGNGLRLTLNDVLFEHFDKQPLLNKITIKFNDHQSLAGVANIFLYLIDKKKEILNPFATRVKIIELDISVEQESGLRWLNQFQPQLTISSISPNKNIIFTFTKNCDYDIDKQKIEVNVSRFDDEELGILYQNIIDWFRRILNGKSDSDKRIDNRIFTMKIQRR